MTSEIVNWIGRSTAPEDALVAFQRYSALLDEVTAIRWFWPIVTVCLIVLWALWPDEPEVPKTGIGTHEATTDDWSLAQAVEHLERWIGKQGQPLPIDIRAWAMSELRDAVILERLNASGEWFSLHGEGHDYPSSISPTFMKGAIFEFQDSDGIDRFDGGLAYRERDEIGYGGVRFNRREIETVWPL